MPPEAVRTTTEIAIDIALGLLVVAGLIVANGLFVAAEFALVAIDRTRLDARAAEGDRRSIQVQALVRRLSFHLSGAQLGITITSLVLGFVAAPLAAQLVRPLLEPVMGDRAVASAGILIGLGLATVVQMVLGELMPKSYAIARPEQTARRLTPVLRLYGAVFGPLIRFLNGAANATVRRFGVEPREELASARSLAEFEALFRSAAADGSLAHSAERLLTRSLRLARKTAADALVPRVEVRWLSLESTAADLVALSSQTGHSRFPVCGADLDDVRGVAHVKAVVSVPADERSTTPVSDLMHEVLAVPESRDLDDLLHDMRRARLHLAVVLDEYGGTAGIITLEDVLEEVVGEITDEHDVDVADLARPLGPGRWLVAGSLHLDDVAERVGLELPPGPYETVAGFVLDALGRIPEGGELVEHEGWELRVARMDRRRVAMLEVAAPSARGGGQAERRGRIRRAGGP